MSRGDRIQPRSVARLAAVQALYQMEVSGVGVDAVVREFSEHRFDRDVDGPDGDRLAQADETFFAELPRASSPTRPASTRPSSSVWPRAGSWSAWTPRPARCCARAPTS